MSDRTSEFVFVSDLGDSDIDRFTDVKDILEVKCELGAGVSARTHCRWQRSQLT